MSSKPVQPLSHSALKMLAAAAVCVLALGLAPTAIAKPGKLPDPSEAALLKLESATSANERANAAFLIAGKPDKVSATTLSALVVALYHDRDPQVRAAVAISMGEIAGKQTKGLEPGALEPKMVEAFSAAFNQETDSRVRRAIVYAAGELNAAGATRLFDKALADTDSSVRAAAHKSRLKREQRLTKLVTG